MAGAAKQTKLPHDGGWKIQGIGDAEWRDEIRQETVGYGEDKKISEGKGMVNSRGARQRDSREMLPRSPSPPQPDAPAATVSTSAARANAYAGGGEGRFGGVEDQPSALKLSSTAADPAVALPRVRAPRIKESPKELLVLFTLSLVPPLPPPSFLIPLSCAFSVYLSGASLSHVYIRTNA